MVPSDFNAYFSASASAAAALVGLLFVAVSLAPESTVTRSAPLRRRAIAVSAFTGLLNAFFISLSALIPDAPFAGALLGLSVSSLISTLISTWLLLTRRQRSENPLRLLLIPLLGFAIYGLEIGVCALPLLEAPTSVTPIIWLAYLLFGVYGLALARAWELMAGVPAAIAARVQVAHGAQVAQDHHDGRSGESATQKSLHEAAPATITQAEDSST